MGWLYRSSACCREPARDSGRLAIAKPLVKRPHWEQQSDGPAMANELSGSRIVAPAQSAHVACPFVRAPGDCDQLFRLIATRR